ncbi:pentatricopeptide repeat-containing protein At5g39350-like [Cornus florida]|uniref:pentatricopeptide repeat-containing protein At5g39350-like n=1 Tax=Cornus florida TaxID=4283 RepID=UPI00289AFDD3|nr:pentatricopeptide repeat-containing protein At5g39350-like [Cornus florida]
MVFNPPWRVLSGSSLRNLWPTLYSSFFTLSSPPNLSLPSTKNHSLHNSINSNGTDFLRLISLCHKIENLKPLKSLLIVHGLIGHEPLVGEFVKLCFHLGAPKLALSTFEKIDKPSLNLQNLMVKCLCNCGLFEDVLCVYQNCLVLGCSSDNYTFPFVLKACSALGALQKGKELHCVVLRTGFGDNLVVQTALVDLYAKCGQMGIARSLLDRISQPDLVSWNALISGYSSNGFNQEAFEVFQEIRVMGLKPNVSTLASIIPIFTRLEKFDIGKSVHGFALKSGYFEDETLTPALISLYAGGGDLSVARNMFDCLLKKNVAIWNAIISAYTQNQKSNEAFEMFRQMLQVDLQPNAVTFVSIIPSCENFGIILYCESLHAHVIKDGLDGQLAVVTALMSMYAKLGSMNSTKFLFDQMPQRNLLSWNSIISGYVHNGLWDTSLDAFREMQFEGFNPDAISIICILSTCCELEAILLGKSAHAFSLKKGFGLNVNVSNALLSFYLNCCQISSAFKLFSRMVVRNEVSWNTMISGCAHNGEERRAVALLHQMQQEGMGLDLVTLVSVLPCYNGTENLVHGKAVHGYAIKMGFALDVTLTTALISMYFNCGELDAGKLLFEVMPNRSVISWNALITGYRYHNLHDEVIMLFVQMIKEDQKPNYVTILTVLPMCYTQLQGKSIHGYATKVGIVLEAPLLTSLLFMYARFKNIDSCMSVFEIGEKSISLWNAIMSVHAQTQDAKKAVAFFCQMLQMGVKPDYVTVLTLISACVQLNNLNLTNSVMAYVIHKGFDKNVAVNNGLIDLYARCGDISMARKLFDGFLEKDSVSWSAMINGHGLHGDGEAALALFSQMKSLGMEPDEITYTIILSACSHAGLVEQGRIIFKSMVEHGISPRMQHYACMVDLLGRTGHLNEAYDIVKNLPHKPSASLLDSLLGACVIHDNIELGEEIGRSLLEMDPENSGSYVMLYNIYAAAGRWTDANRVRSNMEGRQLRKVPGFSIIEGT